MVSSAYNPRTAWLRAATYFAICFVLSWFSGVLPTILGRPLITQAEYNDPVWLAFTAVCLAVVIVGYVIIWPKGTLTHGRKLNWISVSIFGLLWGLSEGQLFASVWALALGLIDSKLIVWVFSFVILSMFLGLWHALYWDIQVAPEHNIAEWNSRKVLLAHIPNLTVTLTHLALYNNFGMFVFFQTIALLASTYFMRFPPFWGKASTTST